MTAPLIACHECDLLQHEVELPSRGTARCARCAAVLYRSQPDSVNRALAYAAGAAVLFVLANTFPLVGLRLKGEVIETTLFGTAQALYADGMHTVAAIVFATIFVAPLIELVAMLRLLLPLRLHRLRLPSPRFFRALRLITPWRMVEVLMLAVLVALVKLSDIAEVILDVALWSLGGLVVLLAAAAATFDAHELWARYEEAR
jgi:paraquat-inducible protein A